MGDVMKQFSYNLIRDDGENTRIGVIFDGFIIFLIILNVFTIILETMQGIPIYIQYIFRYIEVFTIIIFTFEYGLRVWTADFRYPNSMPYKARLKYMHSFMAVIDLMAILPFYLPFIIMIDLRVLRMLRLLRLFRLLKVSRYTNALNILINVLKRKSEQLITSVFVLIVLMVMASILMYNAENNAQPDVFENALSGLWWAISTLTRTGFGNLHPITTIGRLLGAIVSVLGIGLLAVPTGIISSGLLENITNKQINDTNNICPQCGKILNK